MVADDDIPTGRNLQLATDVLGISKPLTALVDACRATVGTLYEPKRIRDVAKAQADAQIVLAQADAESAEIRSRSAERIAYREVRRQKNIDSIASGAFELLFEVEAKRLEDKSSDTVGQSQSDDTSEAYKPPDDDWLHRFFDLCHDVGNREMQIIWSKILAAEFETPGKYSLRVLNAVSMLDKSDAEIFTLCCSFVIRLFDTTCCLPAFRNLKSNWPSEL